MGPSRTTAARWTALVAAMLAALPAAAAADSVIVSGRVLPGHLAMAITKPRLVAPPARRRALRSALPLSVPIRVTDTRGTGAGWAVALTATTKPLAPHHGRRPAIAVRSVTVTCAACRMPRNRVEYPVALHGPRAIRVFGASRHSGMGVMRLFANLAVTGNTTSYAVTVTLAQTAGP